MQPKNWPSSFTYAPLPICKDIHPSILHHILTTGNPDDANIISYFVEKKKVHSGLNIKALKPPHPLAGQHGLFAKKALSSKTEIGIYSGEILLIEESCSPTKDQEGVYCWNLKINQFQLNINSRKFANELVFINDFRGISSAPNVRHKLIIHRGCYYFGIETIGDIEANEELLIDYGATWGNKYASK